MRSLSVITILLLFHLPAQCWWENGHRTTARLAVYYLTPAARTRVATILGVPDDPQSVSDALAAASTWADEIKSSRPATASWHFIDLAIQDQKAQIPDRCVNQDCITVRLDQFTAQLVKDKSAPDAAADLEALRFMVHFAGDIHQPLHASSDADRGGNCELLTPPYAKALNVHALWDGPLVDNINVDDRLLAAELKKELDSFKPSKRAKMAKGTVNDWAWESHRSAIKVIYKRLKIPTEPVEFPHTCKDAPQEIQDEKITVQPAYVSAVEPVVRLQLERGALRLAKLLNTI